MDGGNAINKILFLKVRAMKKDAATLVASGPQGNVPAGVGGDKLSRDKLFFLSRDIKM